LLTVAQAAAAIGRSESRVKVFIAQGRLPAYRHGHAWSILRADLDRLVIHKPGRPTKTKN
jgi:excisionase family DNA binding protein